LVKRFFYFYIIALNNFMSIWYLTPVEYCSYLLNNQDISMVQMYWTKNIPLICDV